ncbi:sulfite exporter TauE/SafE family protein [Clostridiisalibacter paucivorans]|uniref:sulfite exporter TauE/SafE family protein n=1 Tax=Clostridiisalibacter paucivorans TaxID=408753 RepID=UPI00047AA8F3|nr:sulfite exporter TauE/SafE family protein [Clostridiisalibacter paucivorans]
MSTKKKKYPIFLGILVGIINGVFGSGGGIILVLSLIYILHLEEHKSHSTAIFIILPLSVLSTVLYFKNNVIHLDNDLLIICSGSVIGGLIGAKLLNYIPTNALKKIFGIIMIIASVRMVIK